MKTKWLLVDCILAAATGWIILGGVMARRMVTGVWDNNPEQFRTSYQWIYSMGGRWIPIINRLPEILDKKTYIVLLQNNTELRSSGGFMGSYVRIKFDKGGMSEMTVKDIYDPDGQLTGHVEPPVPIQEAFGQGWWRLRDANWDPDFAKAAETVDWFFEQGNEKPIDGIVAVNLTTIKKWIGILGEIKPVTREETVNEDNFYAIAQSQAETEWYPGSAQKRDFLGAVGTALIEKSKSAGWLDQLKIAALIGKELKNKQIFAWVKELGFQKQLDYLRWSGRLEPPKAGEDFLYIVENNLGANKANCCIQRSAVENISDKSGLIAINWENDNKVSIPDKINTWGGDYIDYVRVFLPAKNKIASVVVAGNKLTEEISQSSNSAQIKEKNLMVYRLEVNGDLQTVGFWAITKANEKTTATISFSQPDGNVVNTWLVKRQPGIESFPFTLTAYGKQWKGKIGSDTTIRL